MTNVIAKVHSVHVMNVEQRQAAADPQTKPPDLGCENILLLMMMVVMMMMVVVVVIVVVMIMVVVVVVVVVVVMVYVCVYV